MSAAIVPERASTRTAEWHKVDQKILRGEIIPRDRPAVMKGAVKHWPIVRAAAQSPQALLDYVRARDLGHPIGNMIGRPDIKGFYFFRDDLSGMNFEWEHRTLHATLVNILAGTDHPDAPAIYTGATPVSDHCPEIARENTLDILDKQARAMLWIGNAVTAATHYDHSDGINCIVTGRKRFTFFPPDQLPNLYIGPLGMGPGGQPTSLVKVSSPDLERYPRFAQALAAAETADVEPGDAIFIPNLWWHNVEAFEPLNVSLNYWWFDGTRGAGEPFAALVHGLMSITALPASRRAIWRQMFDHYVFQTDGDPVSYLPPDRRGVLDPPSPGLENYMVTQLIRSLAKALPKDQREQIRHALGLKPR
jgi:hypothetical protein